MQLNPSIRLGRVVVVPSQSKWVCSYIKSKLRVWMHEYVKLILSSNFIGLKVENQWPNNLRLLKFEHYETYTLNSV